MNERRIDDLLRYLDALTRVKADGEYLCGKEIGECIAEVRRELFTRKVGRDITEITTGEGFFGKVEWDLSEVPTAQLTDELTKREGVCEYVLGPHGSRVKISVDTGEEGFTKTIEGPARLLVNTD